MCIRQTKPHDILRLTWPTKATKLKAFSLQISLDFVTLVGTHKLYSNSVPLEEEKLFQPKN